MASYTLTDLRDKVLLWIHGRRLGILGDGSGPLSSERDIVVLDGIAIGSTRSGPNPIKGVAAGSNGAGAITVAGTKVGDNVEIVVNLSTPADASASFESMVTVAGQVQQTSASNLSGSTYLFCVQPQS
jgi:hypothetical protein